MRTMLCLGMIGILAAGGCDDDNDNAGSGSTPTTTPTPAPTPTANQPVGGNVGLTWSPRD